MAGTLSSQHYPNPTSSACSAFAPQNLVSVAEIPATAGTSTGAAPYPDNSWFQYLRTGTSNVLELVNLQAEATQVKTPALNTNPPGGVTTGLKLGSAVSGDRAYAAIFFEYGLFGVRFGVVWVSGYGSVCVCACSCARDWVGLGPGP